MSLSLLKWVCVVSREGFLLWRKAVEDLSYCCCHIRESIHRYTKDPFHLHAPSASRRRSLKATGQRLGVLRRVLPLPVAAVMSVRDNSNPLDVVSKRGRGPGDLDAFTCEKMHHPWKQREDRHLSQDEEDARWQSDICHMVTTFLNKKRENSSHSRRPHAAVYGASSHSGSTNWILHFVSLQFTQCATSKLLPPPH